MRVQTADPLLALLYMTAPEATAARDRFTWLFYGFVYGAVLALIATTRSDRSSATGTGPAGLPGGPCRR